MAKVKSTIATTKARPTTRSTSTRSQIPSPTLKRWSGIFEGEFSGNIFSTKSIDLARSKSKVAIADSLTAATTSVSLSNMTTPVAFIRTAADNTDRYWALGGRLFKTTNATDPKSGWAADAIANTPTAPLYDMIEFGGNLVVAKDTDLTRLVAGTWTIAWWTSLSGASGLTTGKPHRFGIQAGALLITDGRYVHTYDGTIATQNALTLPSQFQAQFIVSGPDIAYIGTKSLNAGNAEVFTWDRANAVYTARYDIGDSECLAGFMGGGIAHIITKKGEIKRFNGQGFTTVQKFPSAEIPKNITNIDPNGISVDQTTVKIMVDFGVIADQRLRSGIWTFELDTNNLYHSGSVKNNVGKDYSQQELAGAGAIKLTAPGSGRYLVGAQPYTIYSGTSIYGIFTLDESASTNRGYFITPKIKAGNVRRFWRQMFVRFANFQASTDRIRVAYRILDSTVFPAFETITWVTATTFTASNANLAVGDFVEILAGDNAGALAKITVKTGAGAPWTFTIDLTLTASTNAARATYMRFIDIGTVTAQSIQEQVFRPVARSNWIQYLIELRGNINSPQLEELIPDGDDVPL